MGTGATVEIHEPVPAGDAVRLVDEVFAWLHDVDRRFSTYRPDSEVSRLQRGEIRIRECSADLRLVLDRCADMWLATDGYFDVYATGPLDPSGFVKGWSVEVASERLASAGAVNHLIDAGGDVRVGGQPAPGEPWRIGVRHPWLTDSLCWVLTGTDIAVATSGTYERGPHVIDPRSGRPAVALRSVTVVGPDLAVADAYATAAVAMGLSGLNWLAGLDGYEAGVVTEDGACHRSELFPALPDPENS